MRRSLTTVITIGTASLALWGAESRSPDEYDDFLKKSREEYASFLSNAEKEYKDFRDRANREYEEFLRNPWTPINLLPPTPAPPDPEPIPDVVPDDDLDRKIRTEPVVIDSIIEPPTPGPRPGPVSPIEDIPSPIPPKRLHLTMYGTQMTVRAAELEGFSLYGTDENAVADGWHRLVESGCDNLIYDCLSLRKTHALPDWGYFKLIDKAAQLYAPEGSAEHALIMGFLLNQSGYKTRFARTKGGELKLLFCYNGYIYDRPLLICDGDWFYAYSPMEEQSQVQICEFGYPKEKELSMAVTESPRFAYAPANRRDVTVRNHPDIRLSLTANRNLIDFFADYPDGTMDRTPLTKWVIHANTPVSKEVKEQLYPTLRKAIAGMDELEAVNLLLKVAESFPYGLDEEIWGRDRAFWMEESWHYPLSDCEDHAIHFSHLVRDLTRIEVALVYYPGHLASAVAFSKEVPGDYITYQGKRYTICDPTYFYASVGMSMTQVDKASATLIPLSR